jgi:cytochrome c oxidase cbb3-type subunit 3
MVGIIFMELLVIVVLLLNIRALLQVEKVKLTVEHLTEEERIAVKKNTLSWWDRFNKLRPVSQESELDLGHEYDGIRELNNRLPPWWLYGFYLTIIFAFVYIWRFHVSHTGPSSAQEYEASVAKAELRIADYLKSKGEAVDENSVTLLTGKEDLQEGKIIFEKSCATCHKITGAGDVGPNLTDDFWIHGNDIKNVFKTIRYGFNAMPQWQMAYSNKQIAQVASYVKSLHGTNPPNPKAPQGTEMKEGNTTTNKTDSTKTDTTRTAVTAKPM